MPFDAMPRKPIAPEIASEIRLAYETLVRLEEFFDAGERWHRGELCDGHGRYCLIGAVDHLRCPDAALRYRCKWPERGADIVHLATRCSL